jgi:glycosyltransferase involved in cell wall biosynthesis
MTLVSCIMPTANRRRFAPEAIRLFLAQDYDDKELIILDDGEDAIADLIPEDPRIHYQRGSRREPIGVKRNLLCAAAHGEIIAHWDDDDWYAPWRLSRQVAAIIDDGADLCGLDDVLFFDPVARRGWEYVYPSGGTPWVYGATFCYRKSLWQRTRFPEIAVGEDTSLVADLRGARLSVLPEIGMYVGLIHGGNTGRKRTQDPVWRPQPEERIAAIVGGRWAHGPPEAPPQPVGSDTIAAPAPTSVCVGILVHSQPERLAETLVHLRANTTAAFDLLLLGDGPDHATRSALAALADCRQSTTAEPRGAAACFNRLLSESDADILIFLESGSLVGPGWLDTILAALRADPCNGLAGPSTNLAWSLQGALREAGASAANVAELAARTRAQFGARWRTLEPLYCLADFCYVVRRAVVEAIGAADEEYGLGPCWEMDYTVRAVRSGYRVVWAQGAYVFRYPYDRRRTMQETQFFEAAKRRYQNKFCGLKLSETRPGYARHCRGEECRHFAPAGLIDRMIPKTRQEPRCEPKPCVEPSAPTPASLHDAAPLISCIMPTRNRSEWVRQSLRYFARQDYPNRELIIIDDGNDDLDAVLPADPGIRHIRAPRPISIGAKRNLGCEAAAGTIIAHWDDDDWYATNRLSAQAAPILAGAAEITALRDTLFFDLEQCRFWQCSPEIYARLFVKSVHGGTLVFSRSVFGPASRYPDLSLAEDAYYLHAAVSRGVRLAPVHGAGLFAYVRHANNAWRFACGEVYGADGWRGAAEPKGFAADRDFYTRLLPVAANVGPATVPAQASRPRQAFGTCHGQ